MGLFGKLFSSNKQESYQQGWDSYFTNVDNILGSIMLDLGLKPAAPIRDLPNVVWISINMNNPRENGLFSDEESPVLYQIEDTLVDKLIAKYNCLYAGRLTSNGHRDLYFYFGKNNGFDKTIAKAMSSFPDYKYDFGIKDDKDWNEYLNFLYPDPVQYQYIMNRRVIINLEKNGDDHEKLREVDHFLYFQTEAGRTGFVQFAEDKGFAVKQTDTKKGKGNKYMLHLTRTDKVDYNSVNEYTIELCEKAPEFEGYYDGWGCPIAK